MFLEGYGAAKIHRRLVETLGKEALSAVDIWRKHFSDGD